MHNHFVASGRKLAALVCLVCALSLEAPRAGSPIRIECIGDSTTAGYTDNPTWDVEFDFGYRLGLYKRLTQASYSFQYVGESPEPWSGEYGLPKIIGTPDLRDLNQDHHRGYAWFTADAVRARVLDWMQVDNPDLILLMIGRLDFPYGVASDVAAVETSLSNLVETIVSARPEARLIVAQISPFTVYEETLVEYNAYIRDVLVPAYASRGKLVTSVDIYADFLLPGGAIDTSLYADYWQHANPAGNDRIAQTWFDAIRSLYPQDPATLSGPPTFLSNGHFYVRFTGSAGIRYRIDRSTAVAGPWEIGFTNLTANAQGIFELEDPNSDGAPSRFYRIAAP
ncbi:MAG: SGNH/GDSL hydrolase family protein [Limisphaerales bacterium]